MIQPGMMFGGEGPNEQAHGITHIQEMHLQYVIHF